MICLVHKINQMLFIYNTDKFQLNSGSSILFLSAFSDQFKFPMHTHLTAFSATCTMSVDSFYSTKQSFCSNSYLFSVVTRVPWWYTLQSSTLPKMPLVSMCLAGWSVVHCMLTRKWEFWEKTTPYRTRKTPGLDKLDDYGYLKPG